MGKMKEGLKKLNSLDFTKEQIINFLLHVAIVAIPFMILDFRMWGVEDDKVAGHSQYTEGKVFSMLLIGVLFAILAIMALRKLYIENVVSLAFLFTILVASIFSPYKDVVFFGNRDRGEGLIMIAIYVLIFILASQYFKPSKITLRIIFISSIIMAIIVFFQFINIDLLAYIFNYVSNDNQDTIGTLGNRNFTGTYACMFLFVSMCIYVFRGKKEYLLYAAFNFSSLMCALTRSGWLALVIVGIIGLFFIIKRRECLKRAGMLLIIFIIIFTGLNLISNNSIINRSSMDNVMEDGELVNSAGDRAEILRISFKAFLQKPFLGTGPDTLKYRLIDDCSEDFWKYAFNDGEFFDKAHNEFMEYAVSDGIFTLISYLVLVIMILRKLIKDKDDDINKVLLITIIGYLVQSFFNISTVGVVQIFWIILGYSVYRTRNNVNKVTEEE